MKFIFILITLIPGIILAQDSLVTITPSMFDETTDQYFLAAQEGWIFKQGNDSTWARETIDITGWQKLKPSQLSIKYADKSGRVEGWFRIKFQISDSLSNSVLGMKQSTWAASDVFINGNFIHSVGNTGLNGNPYRENNPLGVPSFPVELNPGNIYTLALHVVDYKSRIPPIQLKAEYSDRNFILRITGPSYNYRFIRQGVQKPLVFNIIWATTCVVLCFLFWLLYLQNRNERNLNLIALGTTFQTIAIFSISATTSLFSLSFATVILLRFSFSFFVTLACVYAVLTIAAIFNKQVEPWSKILLAVFAAGMIISFFMPAPLSDILPAVCMFLISILFLHYILSSWKNLKGAQWSIVGGLLLTLLSGFAHSIFIGFLELPSVVLENTLVTGYSLSYPISLLIYVSLRFKEIIKEVQENATRVVQLSEEKEQQALNQQQILEKEVRRQTQEISNALDNLKSTQAQLIQSEKMASLGELTSGIAHEIQNPLNFVNNFSDINRELIEELKMQNAKVRNEEMADLLNDLATNEEKINHHGKRADAIVKGMLQHSRSSSGQKEPTDLNALCDEYLRLAYHGLRAKDKNFNADFKTDFDSSLPKVNIIPQDIGRVLLNVISNAFYAVREKANQNIPGYEPTVIVCTKKINDKVEIKVKDNGNGIPDSIKDKIFQPFFTTKPTGQGTGLGLSLSYDIVKAHSGELTIKTEVNKGSEFIISLPG